MSVERSVSPSNLRVARLIEEVAALFEDGVNAVFLVRADDTDVLDEARRYVAAHGFTSQRTFLASLSRGVARLHASSFDAYPLVLARAVEACEIVAELTGASELGVRVAVAEAPMCPALHTDLVTVRAVLTLCGAGTEVVAGMHRAITSRIVSAPTGSLTFLKGDAWPGNRGRGVEHRSPAYSPEPRLLVTVDPLA